MKTLATAALLGLACLALPRTLPAWEARLAALNETAAALQAELATLHDALLARADGEAPALRNRLSPEPPKRRARGYGLLPKILPAPVAAPVVPQRTVYSLGWVSERLREDREKVRALAVRVAAGDALEPLVAAYEGLADSDRNLEEHLDYHALWQRSVERNPIAFQVRNGLLPVAEELSRRVRAGEGPARTEPLRRKILDAIGRFHPTEGLHLVAQGAGADVLEVPLCTDIEDRGFLGAFSAAVEEAYAVPVPHTDRRLEVRIRWRHRAVAELYDGSPPTRGDAIDVRAHVARFTGCPLVLTTGAASTYARIGRMIALGTAPLSGRVLAHEFGHLLGFSDTYFRGFEGTPGSAEGVTLIEWKRLSDDLMGEPARGRVTPAMVEQLVTAYGSGQ